jgi:SAM-dependent methyltransferase
MLWRSRASSEQKRHDGSARSAGGSFAAGRSLVGWVTMRNFDEAGFDRAFQDLVSHRHWQEQPDYYPRYRSRYEAIMRRFAKRAPDRPVDVLDIGGGQLAFLAVALWDDRGCVADLDNTCFAGLRARGIDAFVWNLALEDPPVDRCFDAIFFSEVIAHLPVPGHIALRRLRMLLRPGGVLLCSTPNLYRLRNVVYLLRGRPPFDHFDLPRVRSYGPVVDYTAEHLAWQFEQAGFVDYRVDLEHFAHLPNASLDRVLSTLGAPLRRIPRYRDNLLAVGTAS